MAIIDNMQLVAVALWIQEMGREMTIVDNIQLVAVATVLWIKEITLFDNMKLVAVALWIQEITVISDNMQLVANITVDKGQGGMLRNGCNT